MIAVMQALGWTLVPNVKNPKYLHSQYSNIEHQHELYLLTSIQLQQVQFVDREKQDPYVFGNGYYTPTKSNGSK